MKVVFTIASLDAVHGGPSRSVPALAYALAALGLDLSLVCLRSTDEPAPHCPPSVRLSTIESAANRYVTFTAMRRFRRAIASCVAAVGDSLSLLHDHGLWLPNNHASARAAARLAIPRVVSPRGMLSQWALNAGAWKKRIAWALYQQSDLQSASLLHATSEQEAEEFRRLGLRNPIAIIRNGISSPNPWALRTSPSDIEPSSAFNFQLPTFPGRTVLFLSRIHPKKGLLDLINGWAKLRNISAFRFPLSAFETPSALRPSLLPLCRFVIAGPDEDGHQRELEAVATAAGVREDFHFVGPVPDDDKWELYRAADLFVLPSYSENFGIVVGEALAAGVPVITTRGTPWRDIEQHNCGWWIEPGVDSLTAALRVALASSPEQLKEKGQRGRALIERRYSWSAAAGDMSASYEWLLGRGAKPDCVHT